MLCRLAAFGRWLLRMLTAAAINLGRRLLVAYAVMLPITAAGVALWYALPELDRFGIDFDPLEIKNLGKQGVKVIVGMWLVLGLSTWLRIRQGIDVATWFKEMKDANPIAASLYVTGSFLGVVWFVGKILSS